MSLTEFIRRPEVRERIRKLHPDVPRKLGCPLLVKSRSRRYTLVGTAFDYLVRFELQRRAPNAVCERWIAEYAVGGLYTRPSTAPPSGHSRPGGKTARQPASRTSWTWTSRRTSNGASAASWRRPGCVAEYLGLAHPEPAHQAELAYHAIRLAKLDALVRAWTLPRDFEEASPDDIQDLLALLAVVPFDRLLHPTTLLLNPSFGESSVLVGGADADIISGDRLIEIKTTMYDEVKVSYLDQLLGYLLLSRRQRLIDPSFPKIGRLGLYYARHGTTVDRGCLGLDLSLRLPGACRVVFPPCQI